MKGPDAKGAAHVVPEVLDLPIRVLECQGMNGTLPQGKKHTPQFPMPQMGHDEDGTVSLGQGLFDVAFSSFLWQQVLAGTVKPHIIYQVKAVVLKCPKGRAPYQRIFGGSSQDHGKIFLDSPAGLPHEKVKNMAHDPHMPELITPGCHSCKYVSNCQIKLSRPDHFFLIP